MFGEVDVWVVMLEKGEEGEDHTFSLLLEFGRELEDMTLTSPVKVDTVE